MVRRATLGPKQSTFGGADKVVNGDSLTRHELVLAESTSLVLYLASVYRSSRLGGLLGKLAHGAEWRVLDLDATGMESVCRHAMQQYTCAQ